VSTTPPKIYFPIHVIGTVDVWQDWPPAWWPPKPPPGWPPKPIDLTLPSRDWPPIGQEWPPKMPWGAPPDEYWDFARRFMELAWRIALHRASLGLYAGFPWFNLNDGMLCQSWILNSACIYLAMNWNTHSHGDGTSVVKSVVAAWTELPPFESWKIKVPVGNYGSISLHIAASENPDYTIEIDVYDDGVIDSGSIQMVTYQAGVIIDRSSTSITANIGDMSFGAGGPVVATRSAGWHTLRMAVGKTFSSVYYDGVLVASGAHPDFGARECWLRRFGLGNALLPFKNASYQGGIDYYTNRTDTLPGAANYNAKAYPLSIYHPETTSTRIVGGADSASEQIPDFDFFDIKASTFLSAMRWLDVIDGIVARHKYSV